MLLCLKKTYRENRSKNSAYIYHLKKILYDTINLINFAIFNRVKSRDRYFVYCWNFYDKCNNLDSIGPVFTISL